MRKTCAPERDEELSSKELSENVFLRKFSSVIRIRPNVCPRKRRRTFEEFSKIFADYTDSTKRVREKVRGAVVYHAFVALVDALAPHVGVRLQQHLVVGPFAIGMNEKVDHFRQLQHRPCAWRGKGRRGGERSWPCIHARRSMCERRPSAECRVPSGVEGGGGGGRHQR